TYVGHSGTAYRDPANHAAVKALLQVCGVAPEHEGRLICRKRVGAHKEIWFYFNPEEKEISESIDVAGFRKVYDLLAEPLARAGDKVILAVSGLAMRALVLER
ncbi:MAG: hypothetical protein N3A66_03825, partial [Planctomycetota bacterium]|nr:hypothetical protein [Planctomycetota bacterium]